MEKFFQRSFVLVSFLVGCGGQVDGGDKNATGPLTLTQEDDYTVAGTFVHDVSVIDFVSRVSVDGVSTVELTVNGAQLTVTVDLFTAEASESGRGETLVADDLAVLHAFSQYVDHHGKRARPWERLYKAAAMYAAAPTGYTVVARAITTARGASERDGSGRNSSTVSNEDITYLCYGYGNYPLWNNDDWVWHEHDSVTSGMSGSNEGGSAGHWRMQSFAPAGCRLDWDPGAIPGGSTNQGGNPYWLGINNSTASWWDGASYNDSATPNGYYGQANTQSAWTGGGSCEGRCGPGCPTGIYNYYFTKDCFDHDVCLDYHRSASSTSSSGDCGYEFQDAQGDFISGSTSTYSSWCGPVPSSCPDKANGQSDSTVNQG
jgi:hypothetical protein